MENKEESKKKKLKEYYSNAREFLKDKRNKALVKLIIYAIFFTIVIIFIRANTNKNTVANNYQEEKLPQTITENIKKLRAINNYELDIIFNTNISSNYHVKGIYDNGILKIDIDPEKKDINTDSIYYYDGQKFYQIIENKRVYLNNKYLDDIGLFKADKLYNYLEKASYQSITTDVQNNTTIKSLLKVSDFELISNNNIVNNNNDIIIETIENNKDITVRLDMSNYYNEIDNAIINYILAITYKY